MMYPSWTSHKKIEVNRKRKRKEMRDERDKNEEENHVRKRWSSLHQCRFIKNKEENSCYDKERVCRSEDSE